MNKKFSKYNMGMTYVELIVVLGIFSMMSSVVIFNYSAFQSKVDIKNLANDVAVKIVEAQKAANFGILPSVPTSASWRPSYGIHFDTTNDANKKIFTYFTDLDNDKVYDAGSEIISQINITKGNFISKVEAYSGASPTLYSNMTISFTRPSQEASFFSGVTPLAVSYVQITIISPDNTTSNIKVYPSGRIQIN